MPTQVPDQEELCLVPEAQLRAPSSHGCSHGLQPTPAGPGRVVGSAETHFKLDSLGPLGSTLIVKPSKSCK